MSLRKKLYYAVCCILAASDQERNKLAVLHVRVTSGYMYNLYLDLKSWRKGSG